MFRKDLKMLVGEETEQQKYLQGRWEGDLKKSRKDR